MGMPITIVASGGLPVTLTNSAYGMPMTISSSGGLPVTVVTSGGWPVTGFTTGPDVTAPVITSTNTVSNVENTVLAHTLAANEAVTWAIVAGGADNARFELSGSTLRWLANGVKDFEAPNDADTNNAYIVTVRATDLASNPSTTQTITVTVTNADEIAPGITSSATVSNAENSVLAHALTANESVTWSLVGGADIARFELSGSTLRWVANGTKDFEAPNDADANNDYIVQVRATDTAGNQTNQTITVTVTNVAEGGGGTAGEMFGFFFPLTKAT